MITQQYVSFFTELKKNNTKEWFDKHRTEYEDQVKKPFLELLNALVPVLKEYEPSISENPKDALFRINRDIRFARDKTPYNTMMKAGFFPGGRKSGMPGYYLGISAESIHVGGGMINIKPPVLNGIRDYISSSSAEFATIVQAQSFVEKFGGLKGEKAKRLSPPFQILVEILPEIAYKQYYAMVEFALSDCLGKDNFTDFVKPYFKEISGLNAYLSAAILNANR